MDNKNNFHTVIQFKNGYQASVISNGSKGAGFPSQGGDTGLFEVAIMYDDEIVYDTPITNDVLGWLTFREVANVLDEIMNLPLRVKKEV